jgi:hypothetical protein
MSLNAAATQPSVELCAGAQAELWQSVVRDAENRANRSLDEELQSYLVFTLMRFTADGELGARVMALDLLTSLDTPGSQQSLRLRDVGDRCLLLAGLYPEQARRRHVSLDYFCNIGRSAYDRLSLQLRQTLRGLYGRLSTAFHALVHVLLEVRRLSGQWHGLDPLARLELSQRREGVDVVQSQALFPGAIVISGCGRA